MDQQALWLNCDYLEEGEKDIGLGGDQHDDGEESGDATAEPCWTDLSQGTERRRLTWAIAKMVLT